MTHISNADVIAYTIEYDAVVSDAQPKRIIALKVFDITVAVHRKPIDSIDDAACLLRIKLS